MEHWEGLLQDHYTSQGARYYNKVLQTAERALKDDLAPFETEWIVDTLLFKPLSLLETVSMYRNDEDWAKTIGDAFKLLTEVADKHWTYIEHYYEDIMKVQMTLQLLAHVQELADATGRCDEQEDYPPALLNHLWQSQRDVPRVKLCLLTYDAQTRKQAIHCIIAMLKRAPDMYGDVKRHVDALEEATTCKAPLALLVGTICEYHSEEVNEEYQRIWRIYLNMLSSNKNTVMIVNAVLQGILSLFNRFGNDLPIYELNAFYNNLSTEYTQMSRCEQVVFSILKLHGNLFRERLAEDKRLRETIWNVLAQRVDKNAAMALRNIYETIFKNMDKSAIESIITAELLPRTLAHRVLVKYTALRIVSGAQSAHAACDALTHSADCLQFELSTAVSYEVAEAVCWCIESNMKDSERLLQAAIVFHENLPPGKTREVVVNGVLHAPPEVRKSTLAFLINESVQDPPCLDKYLPLWTELFRETSEPEKCKLAFEDTMNFLLDRYIEINEDCEEVSTCLPLLLSLTSHILSLRQPPSGQDACTVLLPHLIRLATRGPTAALLAAVTASVAHLPAWHLNGLSEIINLNNCADEAALCETCKILILAPEGVCDDADVLLAVQIIFSRNDVEPKLLCQCLSKLEYLLSTKAEQLDGERVSDILNKVRKTKLRKDLTGKDARILQRDVTMFLGKFGNNDSTTENTSRCISILKMKELLSFSLPNTSEAMKINLQRLLELAIEYEDSTALEAILEIILSNWDATTNRAVAERVAAAQCVLAQLAHALCRAATRGDARTARCVLRAVLMCDTAPALHELVTCISEELSPGARRMLSDSLEEVLLKDPASDNTKMLLNVVAERAIMMMASEDVATVRAGLDLSQTLLLTMKGNNDVIQEYLPKVLILSASVNTITARTVFRSAAESFADNLVLFSADALDSIVKEIILTNLKIKIADFNTHIQVLKSIFAFVQSVWNFDRLLQLSLDSFDGTANSFIVLGCFKMMLDFDLDVSRKILGYKESVIMNSIFAIKMIGDDDPVRWDAVFMFLKEYAVILLELHYQKTLQYIADLMKLLKPYVVVKLNALSSCLLTYKTILKDFPAILTRAFEDWSSKLNFTNINMKRILSSRDDMTIVKSLRIFANVFHKTKLYETKRWTTTLLHLYRTKYYQGVLYKMSVFADILAISSDLLTHTDIKHMFLSNSIGLEFCRMYMHVYMDRFISKPYVLLEANEDSCCLLLDVVECCLKRKCPVESCRSVMELIDKLWPRFENIASFNQKHTLLKHLMSFPNMTNNCKPMRWAVQVITAKDADRHQKIRLIGLLPAGDEFSVCYRSYASCLPTRLSEMRGEHSATLRGLLNALAASGDRLLFGIVLTLACSDDTKGWCDEAIDSCMSVLALKADVGMLDTAYMRCWEGLSLGICNRILMPLLRYSSPKFCEEFFSKKITDLFGILRRGHREPSASESYHKSVVTHIKALSVLQIVFEKVPPDSLESANSILHQGLGVQKPWASTSESCKLAVTLREKVVCGSDATPPIRESCRLLQCAAYNCLTAAICRRRPGEKFYSYIFNEQAWEKMVDPDVVYTLPLQPRWRHRSTQRHAVSVDVGTSSRLTSLTAGTSRTRLYLRTLSEDPLQYDMIQEEDDDQPTVNQELQLLDSELNRHECAPTLTALLTHATSLEHDTWKHSLVAALTGDLPKNAKWLLAQAICNSHEDLNPHGAELSAALFRLTADTAVVADDRIVLNGLHLDVINTIVDWNESPELTDRKYLNATVEYLISTCVRHAKSFTIYKSLLDTLDRLLRAYGPAATVSWTVFDCPDISRDSSHYLQILQRLLKHKIHIPEVLPTLLATFEPKCWSTTQWLAEVFGLALSACPENESEGHLTKFRNILEKIRNSNVRDYVKVLYTVQKWCKEACDERHFKIISGLAPNVETPKRLSILSSFMEQSSDRALINDTFYTMSLCELITTDQSAPAMNVARAGLGLMDDVLKRRVVSLVGECCDSCGEGARKAAFAVIVKAFEDLFPTEDRPPAKKAKTDFSPILSCIEGDGYLSRLMENLSRCVLENCDGGAVREKLHTRLEIRTAECFFLTIYQPTISNNKLADLSVCVSTLLEMLLEKIRVHEEGAEKMERTVSAPDINQSKVVALSGTYQGTFRSSVGTCRRRNAITEKSAIDLEVCMTKADVLDTLLHFTKINSAASRTLCIEIVKRVQSQGHAFDLQAVVSGQLARMLTGTVNGLTPFGLELCRVFIDGVFTIHGFQESIQTLIGFTRGTEGADLVTLLYEDLLLRTSNPALFELGIEKVETLDSEMDESEFSLEDLIGTFGKLSNWDDLRIQDKFRVCESGLPKLWTGSDQFKDCLDNYLNTRDTRDTLWFDKMATAYSGGGKQDSMKWLREIDQWPRRHFVVSAVTEAVTWAHEGEAPHGCVVAPADCLAEWAARLMIRSAYCTQESRDSEESNSLAARSLCRSQELLWCATANQRGLPELVLQCVDRNKDDLHESESLSWLEQRVLALRAISLTQRDDSRLKRALDTAEKYTPLFGETSSPDVVIGMEKLILQLSHDLKLLSKPKLDGIMQDVAKKVSTETYTVPNYNATVLKSVYDLSLVYYDELWTESEDDSKDHIISSMAVIVGQQIEYNLSRNYDLLFAMVLNRLESLGEELTEDTARNILDKLHRTIDKLDSFTTDHFRTLLHLFPASVLEKYPSLSSTADRSTSECKQHLELISDAPHTLLSYLEMLDKALKANDVSAWSKTFDMMKRKIFENPYAGTDYRLLIKYKNRLYDMYTYNNTSQTSKTLKEIIKELSSKRVQSTIRLSQLCPRLRSSDTLRHYESALRKLLGIRSDVTIVKFYDEVRVYADSVRRPCVARALLSTGRAVRYLHKCGEPLALDAALQRCAGALPLLCACAAFRGYTVTPLSEDSVIIQFLEEHERLRALMLTVHKLDEGVSRPDDSQLILSPAQSLQTYNQICAKIPRYVLRMAIEQHSTCTEDFIAKRSTFMETLASMTIINWIFGVGDRHLENMMYSIRDGAVCGVDWGALLQFGAAELPPARLTAALLAVCQVTVLEARLQNLLLSLRDSSAMYLAFIKQSFKWMAEDFDDKFTYIRDTIEGRRLSYQITKDSLQKSKRIHKDKYIELLDQIFEKYDDKHTYSVQEQVSCFLQQCTDRRILSVTRRGWQPWI